MNKLSSTQKQKVADQIRRLLKSSNPHEIISGTIGLLRIAEGEGARVKSLVKQLATANQAKAMGGFRGIMDSLEAEAKGYLYSLPAEMDIELDPGYVPSALERVEKICRRFHRVVLQLRQRRANRDILDVKDEYDVQDLFAALLAIEFDDVRAEDPSSQQSGASSRIDFTIPGDDLVIEVKMTRQGLADKKVGEQLLIDIGRYSGHKNCRSLVCFVYDPQHYIGNPSGLTNDLEKQSRDGLEVRVYIEPSR